MKRQYNRIFIFFSHGECFLRLAGCQAHMTYQLHGPWSNAVGLCVLTAEHRKKFPSWACSVQDTICVRVRRGSRQAICFVD